MSQDSKRYRRLLETNSSTYTEYLAGKETLAAATPVTVTLASVADQLLIFPLAASTVKLNGSTEEIYLPENTWTPISVQTTSLVLTSEAGGDVYWQAWVK